MVLLCLEYLYRLLQQASEEDVTPVVERSCQTFDFPASDAGFGTGPVDFIQCAGGFASYTGIP